MASVDVAPHWVSDWRVVFCKTWPVKQPRVMVMLFSEYIEIILFSLKLFLPPKIQSFKYLHGLLFLILKNSFLSHWASHTEYFSTISNWRDFFKARYNCSFFYYSILKFLKELDGPKVMALGKQCLYFYRQHANDFVNIYTKRTPYSLVFITQVQSSMDAGWVLLLTCY